jgi:RNA-directed DNA polymerase
MERPNQPPNTECGPKEGQADVAAGDASQTTLGKRTQGTSQAVSGSRTPLKLSSLETLQHAGGDAVASAEPNTEAIATGEIAGDLPGSKRMAREARADGNLGRPEQSRHANYGSQSGRSAQRQEEGSEANPGIRSVHSSPPVAGEGADITTRSAQDSSAVRTTAPSWSTSLRAIANKAVQNKTHRFGGLYRLLNQANLRECFFQLRKTAAPGVDGVRFEEYEKNLEANLRSLVQRLMNKSYRARLVRRKYIPKGNGKLRPLGIPTLEDKLVQCAVAQILSAIFEADFQPCSYGYRPGRSPQQAVDGLTDTLFRGRYEFVYEADIKGFFDHIQHDWLVRMLEQRIADGALIRLVRKWLRAGILEEDGRVEHPETGTPQGGIVSPVLANVYLHYVLDLWFERKVRKANRGQSRLFRFADDFVCCFDYRHEAEAFGSAVTERLAKFGLELALDKTKILRFGRGGGGQNGRFDFLGFEYRWEKSRKGFAIVKRRTSRKKLRGAVERFTEWIREHRHTKLRQLMKTVAQKHQGHWNYYGIIGNSQSLSDYRTLTLRALYYWLNRRSQRRSYTWRSFNRLLKRFGVPLPRIKPKANATELMSKLPWSDAQAAGVNLLGPHYKPCRA